MRLGACLPGLVAAAPATADIQFYRGTFTGEDFPIPTGSRATGTCWAWYDTLARTLTIEWEVEGLNGVPAVPGMHVHNAPRGEIGNILFVLYSGPWPTSGSVVWEGLEQSDRIELRNGRLYVNMHTTSFPTNGEVRAQLERVLCPADVNRDGVLDNADILAFVQDFLAQSPGADFTGDGIVDNGDVNAFVNAYLAGCDFGTLRGDGDGPPWEGSLPTRLPGTSSGLASGLSGLEGRRPVCDCGCPASIEALASMDPASMTAPERARAIGAGLLAGER